MAEPDFKETIERVRAASDIVDVIGSYVPLQRAGAKFKACSPFNQEKTPSFFVDPAKQFFKCFSSGHGGDVIAFVMLYENLDFMGALRRLAERANIDLPERGNLGVSKEQKTIREQLYQLHESVAVWWASLLVKDPQAEKARTYLRSRDFPMELAQEFGLGYAPDSWDATLNWAQKKGYSIGLLEQAGLVRPRDSGGGYYDFFRGRLMIPIENEIGKVVAFSGRLLDPEAKTTKYVNSPETPIFSKSKILFGLAKNKKGILDRDCAILCEGQIDLMRMYRADIRQAVAPQGTALTEHHAALIKRFAKEVIVCFDSDRAGRNAAVRSVEILLPAGLEVRIAALPQGEDPDSLIRKNGPQALQEILAKAPMYYRYLLEMVCQHEEISSPKGRANAVRQMAEMVHKMPSPTQQQLVGMEISTRLQIPYPLFQQELDRVKVSVSRASQVDLQETAEAVESFEASPIIATLLGLLLHHPEMVPRIQRHLNLMWLESIEGGSLLIRLLESHSHDAWENSSQFLNQLPVPERNYLAGLLLEPIPTPDTGTNEEFALERVKKLKEFWTRQRTSYLEQEIKSGILTNEELLQKTKALMELKRQV